jgi:non-heme chloroperoxidase
MPTLLIHGDDDQIVPIEVTAKRVAKIVKQVELKVYPGGAHGLPAVAKDKINADLLAFAQSIKAQRKKSA